MRLVKGILSDDFYKQYFSIDRVIVSGKVQSQEQLVRFLRNLNYVESLLVKNASNLDQTIYDRLYEFGRLTKLDITGKSSKSVVNFKFLFDLKLLQQFYIDSDSAYFFDLTLALFRRLKWFRFSTFYFYTKFIAISKTRKAFEFSQYDDVSTNRLNRKNVREKWFGF